MDLSYIQRPNPHEGVISVCKFPFACIWGFSAWLSPFIRSHQDGAIFIPEGLVYHEPFNFIVFGNSIYVNYGVGFGPFFLFLYFRLRISIHLLKVSRIDCHLLERHKKGFVFCLMDNNWFRLEKVGTVFPANDFRVKFNWSRGWGWEFMGGFYFGAMIWETRACSSFNYLIMWYWLPHTLRLDIIIGDFMIKPHLGK